jgi:NAD-dependent dihydropyrimidine dehydrogenase PreA subunit
MLRVKTETCTGCGACIEVCPSGAIRLIEKKAEIDPSLCTACEMCADACPTGAIVISREVLPVPQPALNPPVLSDAAKPLTAPAVRGGSWAGLALALMDRWLAPRLVDGLIAALDRRLMTRTPPAVAATSPGAPSTRTGGGQACRRRRRYRGA